MLHFVNYLLELNAALTVPNLQFPVPVSEALHDSSFHSKSQQLTFILVPHRTKDKYGTFTPILGTLMSTSKQAVTAEEVVTDCKLEQSMEMPGVMLEPSLQCCTLFSLGV